MKRQTNLRTCFIIILVMLSLLTWGNVIPAAAQAGGTPPILVVVNNSAPNKFGRYLGEILRAEGLNSFTIANLSGLSAGQVSQYKVVILAETGISGGQATILTNYVNGGGYLIAMRPDAQIKDLFGLDTASGTLSDGYLKMSGNGPSQGLNTSTLQIHGDSDQYTTTAGAVTLAQLYSDATTLTSYPAVVRSSSGHGTAFMYDLARNVVYMRQGNPANANVDSDGDNVSRTIDLFQTTGGGAPWVDLDKVPIPQADEQQRLFARIVQEAISVTQPMPQLWYFPDTAKTMLIPTGDAHANQFNYFETVIDSVNEHHGRITVYLTAWDGTIQDADAIAWSTDGNSFGIHPYGDIQPTNYQNLEDGYAFVYGFFNNRFTVPMSQTVRNHQITWVGWTDAAEIAIASGMKMDTNFYNWGPWLQKSDSSWAHGYTTGSGQPMKFVKADGTILPMYQQLTQLIDEQFFPIAGGFENRNIPQSLAISEQLIDASEAGDYAALMTQFHIDYDSWGEILGWVTGTLDYAYSKGIPIWNADQWLSFTETRHDANYTNIAWDGITKTLSFGLNAASTSGMNLSTIVPLTYGGSSLSGVTVDGAAATYTIQTIKGIQVAFITVPAGNHTMTAVYQGAPVVPTLTPSPGPTATFTPTATNTPTATFTPTATNTPPPGCFVDDTVANFSLGANSSTFVSDNNNGQVTLAPIVTEHFNGATVPAGWTANEWIPGSGGSINISGSSIALEGARAGTDATYPVNSIVEFVATFRAAAWQHVGWVSDFEFNQNWAIFSTYGGSTTLYTRTSDGNFNAIAGNWIGSPHHYRIERTTTQVFFSIDGVQVAAHNFDSSEPMRPLMSNGSINGQPLSVDWLTVSPYAPSGTYTSRVYDAGSNMNWGTVTYIGSGSTLAISARTGNTASPDGSWTAFTNVAASGNALGLAGRYIQYRAELSTANISQTPTLDVISFACSPALGNQAPSVTANQASVTVNEGQGAANTGTFSDPESDTLTLSASVGTVTNNGNGTWSWSYGTNDGPAQSGTVTITAADSAHSNSGQTSFALTVNNVPPTATFGISSNSIIAGESITLTFSNTADVSTVDTTAGFTYAYDCTNDGSFELSSGAATSFDCTYPASGTYTVLGRITDKDGGFTNYNTQQVVVTDPATATPVPTNTPTPPPVVGCFVDNVVADFSLGTNSSTFVSDFNGGQVVLAPIVGENFNGTTIPANWTASEWTSGSGGSTTVANGSISVDGSRAATTVEYGTGSLEFVATFGTIPWQHVGWASGLNLEGIWAIFSTSSTSNQLFARISDGTNVAIPGNWLGTSHRYRIDRTATQAIFFVDGTQVAALNFPWLDPMRPFISEGVVDSNPVSVDSVLVSPYAASGTFTSRVYDGGSSMDWGTVTYATSGANVTLTARTGNTAVPNGSWTAFTALPASGGSLGLTGRYIQYRAEMSTANISQAPALEAIGFACTPTLVPNQPPTVSANQASVTADEGQSASNTGSFNDPENGPVTLTASIGNVTDNGNGTWSWSYATTDGPAQSSTVTITVTDNNNHTAQTAFGLTVNNLLPTATFVNSSGQIVAGQSATLTFSAPFDPSSVDVSAGFTYSYDCTNDGSFELSGSTSATFNCTYPTAGNYTAAGRITDKDGGSTIYTVQVDVVAPTATPTNTPEPTATPTNTPEPTATPTNTPTNTPLPVTGCFVDDTLADFSLGTNSNTFASEINGGQITLAPTVGQNFTGTTLPAGWSSSPWVGGGTSTVSGSNLNVEGARAGTTAKYAATASLPVSVEFIATFRNVAWQHAGWVGDFNFDGVWAIFSTYNTTNQLYARTSYGTNTLIPGNWLGAPHRFRIDRTTNQVAFYIDNILVTTHPFTFQDPMLPLASDSSIDGITLPIDWLIVKPYAASGTFTSRVFNAGASMNWSAVTYAASGATITINARTGNTATPNASWTPFVNIAASGNSLGQTGQYIQYQVVMSTTDRKLTPVLDNITFACSPSVSGSAARSAVVVPVESGKPVDAPTAIPTEVIVEIPAVTPTEIPTEVPPTDVPTATPTLEPTAVPPTNTPEPTATVAAPTAAIGASVDNGTAPLAVQFSSQAGGNITSYSWSFGDGGTSADANPSYIFATAGTYTVVVTVTGPGGSASAQTVITVS